MPYPGNVSVKLETAYQSHEHSYAVDTERFPSISTHSVTNIGSLILMTCLSVVLTTPQKKGVLNDKQLMFDFLNQIVDFCRSHPSRKSCKKDVLSWIMYLKFKKEGWAI